MQNIIKKYYFDLRLYKLFCSKNVKNFLNIKNVDKGDE